MHPAPATRSPVPVDVPAHPPTRNHRHSCAFPLIFSAFTVALPRTTPLKVGNMVSMVSDVDAHTQVYHERMDAILCYMQQRKFPDDLQKKVGFGLELHILNITNRVLLLRKTTSADCKPTKPVFITATKTPRSRDTTAVTSMQSRHSTRRP